MADFNLAIPDLLKAEGGYTNHPNDKGGETNFGITVKKARKFKYCGEMKDMPIEFAKSVYKKDYWDRMHLDEIFNQTLAGILFNFGVHCGTGTASKTLQRTLNILNRNSVSWFDTIMDGIIGPRTRGIVNNLSIKDLAFATKIVIGLQFERYIKIVERDTTQEIFIRGWVNRIEELLKTVRRIV